MSAASLLTLLFQYINVLFPDPLAYASYDGIAGAIRYAMASLMIVFPVYIFISRMLYREYLAEPEKREYRFRKWLVYFTLFAAGITIIIDLIVLIYNFLGGDLSSRFILKILVVLLIAVVVFWYYRKDLKNALSVKQVRVLSYGVSAFVLLAIIFGFFTAGSPLKARLYNFDERKVSDLTNIQYQIINYWQRKEVLPAALSDLTDSISGFTAPVDPQSKMAYEYRITNAPLPSEYKNLSFASKIQPVYESFELCAEFNLPSNFGLIGRSVNTYPAGAVNDNWDHAAGRVCFERTIDPALYPKINNVAPAK